MTNDRRALDQALGSPTSPVTDGREEVEERCVALRADPLRLDTFGSAGATGPGDGSSIA